MGNLVIDVWVNGNKVQRFDDKGDEYTEGRLMWIDCYKGKVGISVWFE